MKKKNEFNKYFWKGKKRKWIERMQKLGRIKKKGKKEREKQKWEECS